MDYSSVKRFPFIIAIYKVVLGDYGEYGNIVPDRNEYYLFLFFFSTTMIITIIMLNLLISLISDTFARVLSNENYARNFERTKIIYEIESDLSEKEIKKLNIGSYLIVAKHSAVSQDEEEASDKIKSKIEIIEKFSKKINHNFIDLSKKIEDDFEFVNRKIEEIANQINSMANSR